MEIGDFHDIHANGRLPASFIGHSLNGGNFDMRLGGGVNMSMSHEAACREADAVEWVPVSAAHFGAQWGGYD